MLYSVELRGHVALQRRFGSAKIGALDVRAKENFRPADLQRNIFAKVNIEIWSIGKESDSFIADGVAHYLKKAKPYVQVSLQIIAPPKGLSDPDRIRAAEEILIVQRLQPAHHLILLDERGKMLTSPGWAQAFQELMNRSTKTVVLLIGGAHGVSDALRTRAQMVWSLSGLVFPHQLVRLMVAEQVYRAYSILAGSPYHHP